jgi:hypothetical protein
MPNGETVPAEEEAPINKPPVKEEGTMYEWVNKTWMRERDRAVEGTESSDDPAMEPAHTHPPMEGTHTPVEASHSPVEASHPPVKTASTTPVKTAATAPESASMGRC